MNIFWLDRDLTKCAKSHCDKHVVKMILESCQLLATAHWECGSDATYKATHVNHPCAIWVRQTRGNYLHLVRLAQQLCIEYTHRYKRQHKCHQYLFDGELSRAPIRINDGAITVPPLAMPEHIQEQFPLPRTWDDVIEAYRIYYQVYKHEIATWKYSDKPEWMF